MQIFGYFKSLGMSFLATLCLISLITTPSTLASDHLDSPSVTVISPTYVDAKSQDIAKPLTGSGKPEDIDDFYMFREVDQNPSAKPTSLCFVMTTNGFIAPGQIRYFSPNIAYQIRVATDKNDLDGPTRKILSFRFGLPDFETGAQKIYLSDSSEPSTTPIGQTAGFNNSTTVVNQVYNNADYNNKPIKVFAGEMDDPSFLDFRIINEGLLFGVTGTGSIDPKRKPSDSFAETNVNAIVVTVPMAALQTNSSETTFYAWAVTLK